MYTLRRGVSATRTINGVRRIDAFVGASQSPIARVQDAQPQADRTVVGHRDAKSNQAVEGEPTATRSGLGSSGCKRAVYAKPVLNDQPTRRVCPVRKVQPN